MRFRMRLLADYRECVPRPRVRAIRSCANPNLRRERSDQGLLAIEAVDAAGLLIVLTDAVLAVEHAHKLDHALKQLPACAARGREDDCTEAQQRIMQGLDGPLLRLSAHRSRSPWRGPKPRKRWPATEQSKSDRVPSRSLLFCSAAHNAERLAEAPRGAATVTPPRSSVVERAAPKAQATGSNPVGGIWATAPDHHLRAALVPPVVLHDRRPRRRPLRLVQHARDAALERRVELHLVRRTGRQRSRR